MYEDTSTDEYPTRRLNPLGDDCLEYFYQALEEAGYPGESVVALRRYGDPRPRSTLPDGTKYIVQHVPRLPPMERVQDRFFRLVAKAVGCPVYHERRKKFWRALQQQSQSLPDAVLSAYWTRGAGADDRIAQAAEEAPDPHDEAAFREFANALWNVFCNALDWPVQRAVLGEEPDRQRPVPAIRRDPDTGEVCGVDPDSQADPLADPETADVVAREAERAAGQCEELRNTTSRRQLAYLDELERLIGEGVPVDEAKVEAGRTIGLDANATRQLRSRIRRRNTS